VPHKQTAKYPDFSCYIKILTVLVILLCASVAPKPVIGPLTAAAAGPCEHNLLSSLNIIESSSVIVELSNGSPTKVFQKEASFDSTSSEISLPQIREIEQPWTSDDSSEDEQRVDEAAQSLQVNTLSSLNVRLHFFLNNC